MYGKHEEVPICQIHGDELRQEYLVDDEGHGYISGFCFKCAKHYRLCGECRYMSHCIRREGHEGNHLDSHRTSWKTSDVGHRA
jgi:hypothetical protein